MKLFYVASGTKCKLITISDGFPLTARNTITVCDWETTKDHTFEIEEIVADKVRPIKSVNLLTRTVCDLVQKDFAVYQYGTNKKYMLAVPMKYVEVLI